MVDRLRRQRHDDLPGAVRRLAGHADHGGAVPRAARAVPRGRGRLRPGHAARRADRPLDRRARTPRSRSPTSSTARRPSDRRAGRDDRTSTTTHRADDRRAPTDQPRPTDGRGRRSTSPLAELRPALEAVLMVADQPLDDVTLATAVGYPVAEVVDGAGRAGRGVRRAGPRLRAAQRRRRLALLHPRGVRRRSSSGSCSTGSRPG